MAAADAEITELAGHLERAMELGFQHRDWVMSDSELETVRTHPRFQTLVTQFMPMTE